MSDEWLIEQYVNQTDKLQSEIRSLKKERGGLEVEVTHYLKQMEEMQFELSETKEALTKAQELLMWFYSHSNVAQVGTVMMNKARDYLAHQSAPAAKGEERIVNGLTDDEWQDRDDQDRQELERE